LHSIIDILSTFLQKVGIYFRSPPTLRPSLDFMPPPFGIRARIVARPLQQSKTTNGAMPHGSPSQIATIFS